MYTRLFRNSIVFHLDIITFQCTRNFYLYQNIINIYTNNKYIYTSLKAKQNIPKRTVLIIVSDNVRGYPKLGIHWHFPLLRTLGIQLPKHTLPAQGSTLQKKCAYMYL